MKWYHRALSGVLAASMGAGLLGGVPFASAAADEPVTAVAGATGDIQATLRLDYPISVSELSDARVALLQGGRTIADGALGQDGELAFTAGQPATGTISQRTTDGRVSYVDIQVQGLSANQDENSYQLKFTGTGFKTYTSEALVLDQYSQGIVLGTGDATFTQGDVNADGKVDSADIEALKAKLGTSDSAADLNGDGTVDVSDLAIVTFSAEAKGEAQMFNTALIASKVVDTSEIEAAIQAEDATVEVRDGEIASLFQDDGKAVTLGATDGNSELALPIPLAAENGIEMEQVEIISSAANPVEKGIIEVDIGADEPLKVPFDYTTPEGVYAIQTRDDGRKTVVINLGQRVPVKKITIRVELHDNQPVVVEQIKFVQDIVPEEPAVEDVRVKNVQATAGAEQVTLTWDAFPNITGYKIYYGDSRDKLTSTAYTSETTYTVGDLENLKTYYFAVAPISEAGGQTWEGGKSDVVSAAPQPNSVPDKPDYVTVTPGDTLLTVTWKPGKDTVYSKVQYRAQGQADFTEMEGKYQDAAAITGLENDVTYEVRVYGVNAKGNGPMSETAVGTPEMAEIEGPTLPSTNRLQVADIIQNDEKGDPKIEVPSNNTDTKVSKGSLPGSIYDGDYRTSWVASTYQRPRAFTFTFNQAYEMNYLIYVPDQGLDTQRNDGKRYRDYFTSFNIWINGEQVNASQVSFEKAKDNAYFIVKFPKSMVNSITVEGNQWGGAGNISLSEIAFYEYDGLAEEISALFANDSHTALAQGVDQSKIDELRARVNNVDAYYVESEVMLDELANAEQILKNETLNVKTGFESRAASADSEHGQSASALQPLGVSALSGKYISLYVEGIPEGESLNLVQWQHYSETNATTKTYALQNGRNRIWLEQIGNSGSGERGGSLYVTYSGSNAGAIKIQVRDTSESENVITNIPTLNIKPDQWYDQSESARKALIQTYVETLKTYVAGLNNTNKTNTKNATEIATPSVLLSLPANQVLNGLGGANADVSTMTDKLYDAIVAWEQLIFLANKTQGIIDANASFDAYEYPMQTRQNIRFSRMFSGAFMFAAGSYVGIEYDETDNMVMGYPLGQTGSGGIDADDVNGLYGWGIAHEVGHNMDKIGYAEITNNIYSLVVQTADIANMTGPSRLEGMYDDIFNKVALGKPGQAGNVFVQLGMYWQLHLAYDEGGNALTGGGSLDFFNEFFKKWKDGAYSNVSKDDRIALIASEVAGKDLTEFFTRWGMELSESTKSQLKTYGAEEREIWYLSDESRRLRLTMPVPLHVDSVELAAEVKDETNVELTITVSGNADQVQGYEILRNGVVIGFLKSNGETTQTYTDKVGSANNMAMEYEVRAIDKLGYEAATAKPAEVRISYDKTIDADQYTIVRDEASGNILITAKNGLLTTAGIKIDGDAVPTSGSFFVMVTDKDESEEDITDLIPVQPAEPEQTEDVTEDVTTGEDVADEDAAGEDSGADDENTDNENTDNQAGDTADGSQNDSAADQTPEGENTEDQNAEGETVEGENTEGETVEGETGEEETTVTEDVPAHEDAADENPEASIELALPATARMMRANLEGMLEDDSSASAPIKPVIPNGDWTIAKSGRFENNNDAQTGGFLTYFNKPGTDSSDTRIWMYDAKHIAISGIPTDVDLSDIHLLDYPGDNIAFTEGASIGVLGEDYTYEIGGGETETIDAGTVIVTGSYRGDPLYNSIHILAKTQTVQPGSDAAPAEDTVILEGETLLFAEVPKDGAVSDISDGFFLFIPADQDAFKRVNEDHSGHEDEAESREMTVGNAVLVELQAQMWRSPSVTGENYRMTSDTLFISVPRYDSMPEIVLENQF